MTLKDRREKSDARENTLRNFLGGSRNSKKGGGRNFAGPIIIACAVIAMIVAADYWINAGKIYRGVEVGTIALGGKTPEEAKKIITERTTGALLKEIKLSGPQDFSRSAADMGVDFNVSRTVDQAYAVGREGNLLDRLGERLKAAYGTVTIPPDVNYQPEKARVQVENLAARLDEKPKDATMDIVGPEVEIVGSKEGYKTDVAATMKSVNGAVEDMTGEAKIVGEVLKPQVGTSAAKEAGEKARKAMSSQMVVTSGKQKWTVTPSAIGDALDVEKKGGGIQVSLNRDRMRNNLANVYAALTVKPVEANYVVNGSKVTVQPGQTGVSVEDKKFIGAIEDGIFDGKHSYTVPVTKDEPNLTTTEAEKLKPTDLLSSYQTNYLTYDDSPGRVTNLETASGAVNGTLLAPGEVFSFNALAEPLQYEKTKVIIKGKVDEAEGGGLCQVSSTLYMAANLAGLDVIERHPHYAELPYIQPGFDATVWFGALDMQFKNTSPGYVLIQEWVDDQGYVNANIYGKPSGVKVDMDSQKVSESTDSEGNPVTKWVTYQKITKNGKVVFDDVLHEDTYKFLKPAEEDNATSAEVPSTQ
ncbi:MAG TPA: VanW family protein [Rubrobacteraceae bacterium]|nr:VanW family protein [Rubrobacteraceae bacterium]